MPSSTAKRVILYRFDRQPLEGIVNPAGYLQNDHIELITVDGSLRGVFYTDVKALCFVSEACAADLFTDHTLFERRPKIPGLWTRFLFRDGDKLEGVLSHNLLDWPQAGYLITPPRSGTARQRVFIPRAALSGTELRGVVGMPAGSATQRKKTERGGEEARQLTMFDS